MVWLRHPHTFLQVRPKLEEPHAGAWGQELGGLLCPLWPRGQFSGRVFHRLGVGDGLGMNQVRYIYYELYLYC